MERKIVEVKEDNRDRETLTFDAKGVIKMPQRFAVLNRLITRDLNGTNASPTFYRYSKDDINSFLQNPYTNQKNLRNAAIYIYGASSHFRRLVQYFVGLTDLPMWCRPIR